MCNAHCTGQKSQPIRYMFRALEDPETLMLASRLALQSTEQEAWDGAFKCPVPIHLHRSGALI